MTRGKKLLIYVLLASLLLIFGCSPAGWGLDKGISEVEKVKDESNNEQVKYEDLTAEEWLSLLEPGDFGGYEFKIATSRQYRFVPDETMAGTVNPAIEKRNQLVHEKYNVVIKEVYYGENELLTKLSQAVDAGVQFSDLVSVTMPTMAGMAYEGRLLNLFSVPFFNPDASYLNQETVKSSVAGDYMYAIYDRATFYQEDFWCIFYNEDLLPAGAGREIFNSVKQGKWTWDKLMDYAEYAAREVMKKRSPDYQTDIFGLGSFSNKDDFAVAAFNSSGLSLFGDTYHKKLAYSMNTDKGNEVADRVRDIIQSKAYIGLSGENASKAFLDGRVAFFAYRVDFAKAAAETRLNWSIAPLPKITENQTNYLSYVGSSAAGLSVPARQTDSSRTGKVLNALLAASYVSLDDAIQTNYITFCLRDNDSAIMLKRVFENPVIDIATVYSKGYGRLSFLTNETILKAVNQDVSFAYLFMTNAAELKEINENEFR